MSLIFIQKIPNLKIKEKFDNLSKLRIIQKDLVHFQGFPDEINDTKILSSPEYFGQYGTIKKICIVPKKSKDNYNSCYITFEKEEQAAYCILAVDSIKIKNKLVRAFFGTTKYCNNFIKGYMCLNKNCKFMHHMADNKEDIVINDIKFGYSEHINLAKKIIGFGTQKSFNYIQIHYNDKIKHILPDIRNIYSIQHINDKNKNHRRKISSSSSNNSTEDENEIHSNKSLKNENKEKNIKKLSIFENKNIDRVIEGLLKRKFFFGKFENFELGKIFLNQFEKDFCSKIFKNSEDDEYYKFIFINILYKYIFKGNITF